MSNSYNMNLTLDSSEVSVYNTPDTTIVLDDSSLEDRSNDNVNISMIEAEQGGRTPRLSRGPAFINPAFSNNNSVASSIGENTPTLDTSTASAQSVRSGHSKRKRDDSPDSYSMVMEDEVLSDNTDSGADVDTDTTASVSDMTLPAVPSQGESGDVKSIKADTTVPTPPQDTSPIVEHAKDSSSEKEEKAGGWYDEHTQMHLPDTVSLMKTNDGSLVYLVGTVHFSAESHNDVSMVIKAVQPHIVLVELCKSRIQYLQLDEEAMLREAKTIDLPKIRQIIRKNGIVSGLLFIFLLKTSAHIAEQIGTAPGVEFRRAVTEAEKVPGCMIQLGDRSLDVTLRRVMAALSWWDSVKLMWGLLRDKESITKEEIEKLKNRGMLDDLLAEMAEKFPAVRHAFVDERDTYMAHSLQLASLPRQLDETGVPVPRRVVGVVGIGHINGIMAKWGKVSTADIISISEVPPPTLTTKLVCFSVRASFWALLIYGVTRIGCVRRTLPSLDALKTAVVSVVHP